MMHSDGIIVLLVMERRWHTSSWEINGLTRGKKKKTLVMSSWLTDFDGVSTYILIPVCVSKCKGVLEWLAGKFMDLLDVLVK